MTYQVKTEKIINRTPADVFQALAEGRLFLNTGADADMTIDFRVGGKYHAPFKRYGFIHHGEFLEIIPNKKIVFNWCQAPDKNPNDSDSTVTIELFAEGEKTKLVLLHTGFRTQAIADNHQGGWDSSTADFAEEVQSGQVRMVRTVAAALEKTFESCKNSQDIFAAQSKISDMSPNQKLILSSPTGQVTLLFSKKEDSVTRLEMIYKAANIKENPMAQRKALETATAKISQSVAN